MIIFCTSTGKIKFFNIQDLSFATNLEFQHNCSIHQIYPNNTGTRVVYVDEKNNGFLFNPASYDLTLFPDFPSNVQTIMWDQSEKNLILIFDGNNFHTYVYAHLTIRGPMLMKLGPLEIDESGGVSMNPQLFSLPEKDYVPIMSCRGEIKCHSTLKGGIQAMTSTMLYLENNDFNQDKVDEYFTQNLALNRLGYAWRAALIINKKEYWLALGNKALQLMDIDMAIRVYRQLGDAGMVMSMEKLVYVEDKNLLSGHILLLFMDYDIAQELFLASSRPVTALEMRRDLRHWEEALELAAKIAPDQIPVVSMEYAQHQELSGDEQDALRLYEKAMEGFQKEKDRKKIETMRRICTAGIARTSLKNGNLSRGIKLAQENPDHTLCCECAEILISIHQLADAAKMFEMVEKYEKAVEIYIEIKEFNRASKIIHKISSTKLLVQYGVLCEELNEFSSAVEVYKRSKKLDDVVRLYIGPLNAPHEAITIVRETKSSSGAFIIAKYCKDNEDYKMAIEFFLFSGQKELAFECAKKYHFMDVYSEHISGSQIQSEDALQMADYYELHNNIGKAGHYYSIAKEYKKSFKLFLQTGETYLSEAIEVVGKAKDDDITHKMIDYLMGETDGQPKEPEYVYQLYMALENYIDAAQTAIIIAEQEQSDGNYDVSYQVVYNAIHELEVRNIPVPQKLRQMFVLYHSYRLAKIVARTGDHESTARLLLRVVKQAKKFPFHNFSIFISSIIECQKSGLKVCESSLH